MADGLCGPSNALQNIQKHSTVDRTLQQDRLIARKSTSQGFRSSPSPNAALLDLEFEAFQTGQLPPSNLESRGLQPQGFPHASQSFRQGQPSAWANDFQRLNISSPPQFQQHSFIQQSQQRQDTGGWHQNFARQQSPAAEQSMAQFSGQASSPYRFSPTVTTSHFASSFATPQVEQSSIVQQHEESFDDEAFARAFDEAAKSEIDTAQETRRQQELELGQDIMINKSTERMMASDHPMKQARLGADLIHDPLQEDRQERQQQGDPDALARTAAQLLDSVRDNQSDKFQNSQFLELMRQLRDREVTVEGDKIVGTHSEEERQAID